MAWGGPWLSGSRRAKAKEPGGRRHCFEKFKPGRVVVWLAWLRFRFLFLCFFLKLPSLFVCVEDQYL
jgi:hypothetical protein